jgi:hypothetical protein
MPTISFVTPEEHEALKQEVAILRSLLKAYVSSQEEWLDTAAALRVTGIARSTLTDYKRADAPGMTQEGRITYRKEGTKCLYLRSSCIVNFKLVAARGGSAVPLARPPYNS